MSMTKYNLHAENRSAAIFGAGDPEALWVEIINQIPAELLTKPDVRILNVASGFGTEARILAKRMIALGVTVEKVRKAIWILDKSGPLVYKIKHRSGFENCITADFIEWKTDVKFDIVIGNPPYNSTDTCRSDTNHRGQGDNLAKKFTLRSLELATSHVILVLPYGHRTFSPGLQKLFSEKGLKSITNCKSHFKQVSTNPCVFMFEMGYTGDIINTFNSHGLTVPEHNVGSIFKNQPGKLNRSDYEHLLFDDGEHEVVVTTSRIKFTNDAALVNSFVDRTKGSWRVVINCTTSAGALGKVIVVGPNATLSKSVHCFVMKDEESAHKFKQYLESEVVKQILIKVKNVNACNSKKYLQYIPMPC